MAGESFRRADEQRGLILVPEDAAIVERAAEATVVDLVAKLTAFRGELKAAGMKVATPESVQSASAKAEQKAPRRLIDLGSTGTLVAVLGAGLLA